MSTHMPRSKHMSTSILSPLLNDAADVDPPLLRELHIALALVSRWVGNLQMCVLPSRLDCLFSCGGFGKERGTDADMSDR